MKTKIILPPCLLLSLIATVFSQGLLTPPGAPAPTMKTLDQVEPRTIINSTNTPGDATNSFIIIAPGSYYLTGNTTGVAGKRGINIAASDVTINLNGFALIGVASSLEGINVSGARTNISVCNGTVRTWGGDGINALNASHGQYQDLRLTANGLNGLNCGQISTVVNCTASGNTSNGFFASTGSTINGCAAQGNTGNGISAGDGGTLTGCSVISNSLDGINAGLGGTVQGCTAQHNQMNGITVGSGCTVSSCTVYSNQTNGLDVGDGCMVHGCTVRSNGSTGILADFDCTVAHCTVRRNNGDGIAVGTGGKVSECTGAFNGYHGIVAAEGCQIRQNNCRQNGRSIDYGAGIYSIGENNRIEDNNSTYNDLGIRCNPGSIVLRNTAAGNTGTSSFGGTADYDFNATTTTYGPIVTKIFGVLGTTTNENHPWANFRY